jgi:hypothetical protein
MSTRDEGVFQGPVSPATTQDFRSAGSPHTPPAHALPDSEVATGPVLEQHHTRSEDRRDRVRWGPIWAGATVVLTVFVVLQLLSFALGWLVVGCSGTDGVGVTAGVRTGVLALIAFFVGGLTVGASTMWRKADDGMLHGVLVWALSVLGILALALIGGRALLSPLANFVSQAPDAAAAAAQNVDVAPVQAMNTAHQTADWTALGLGATMSAAAIGGIIGLKIWPGRAKHWHPRNPRIQSSLISPHNRDREPPQKGAPSGSARGSASPSSALQREDHCYV